LYFHAVVKYQTYKYTNVFHKGIIIS